MYRILDKVILLAFCGVLLVLWGASIALMVSLLTAVSLAAAAELPFLPRWVRRACPLIYCGVSLVLPEALSFLPLVAGDLHRLPWRPARVLWLVPLVVQAALPESLAKDPAFFCTVLLLSGAACLLAWQGDGANAELSATRVHRDKLAQASQLLALRNHNLRERQELELRLATLDERGRIAREIHDNVGHLLIRSVLQMEALQVAHAANEPLARDLLQINETLSEAFASVRTSVHHLHGEAFDLRAQLEALACETQNARQGLAFELDFCAGEMPSQIAYAFLAIVREALSNCRRHSNATRVRVVVVEFPALYQLTVHDNGSLTQGLMPPNLTQEPPSSRVRQGPVSPGRAQGLVSPGRAHSAVSFSCAQEPMPAGGGLGLISMEERVSSLGGHFRAGFAEGYKVFASVPKTTAQTESSK